MEKIDALIIGAGPAGITAAIYLKRSNVSFKLLEKAVPGGKINYTAEVENYPGYNHVLGSDLAMKFVEQLSFNEIPFEYGDVKDIREIKEGVYQVETDMETYETKAIIIASGTLDRRMNIENEEPLIGHGISSCAVCDGGFFKGKPIAVIGGGNSALEESLYLSSLSDEVYLIHRRDEFRGDSILVDLVKKNEHIKVLTPYVPIKVVGEKIVEGLILQHSSTKEIKEIKVSAIFPYIGADANTSFVKKLDILDDKGFIMTNERCETKKKGIYASGDCIVKELRQIVTATNDGAIAAINLNAYLKTIND